MKRFIAIIVVLMVALGMSTSASADKVNNSLIDSLTMPGVPLNFDIDYIGYQEFTTSPNLHYFYIWTKAPILEDQFNDFEGSFAAIELNSNFMDGVADFRVETTQDILTGRFGSPARTLTKKDGKWVDSDFCGAKFFGNLDLKSEWVGFAVPYNCFELPTTFGVNAYTEFRLNGNRFYDLSFDSESKFFLTSHSFTPTKIDTKPKTSATINVGSFSGNWAVVIQNGRGSKVSVKANKSWYKFTVPNNNYLFKKPAKKGSKVAISVWVDGTLYLSETIRVK
jgi:hypothetical protein